jgi:hypothetical protein
MREMESANGGNNNPAHAGEETRVSVKCIKCDILFNNESERQSHQRIHHQQNMHVNFGQTNSGNIIMK